MQNIKIGDDVRTPHGIGQVNKITLDLKCQRYVYDVEFANIDIIRRSKRKEISKFWDYEIKKVKI